MNLVINFQQLQYFAVSPNFDKITDVKKNS